MVQWEILCSFKHLNGGYKRYLLFYRIIDDGHTSLNLEKDLEMELFQLRHQVETTAPMLFLCWYMRAVHGK